MTIPLSPGLVGRLALQTAIETALQKEAVVSLVAARRALQQVIAGEVLYPRYLGSYHSAMDIYAGHVVDGTGLTPGCIGPYRLTRAQAAHVAGYYASMSLGLAVETCDQIAARAAQEVL